MSEYYRPKTRGELRDKLKEGVRCEVTSYTASMTEVMLRGWLEFNNFSVSYSGNLGWSLFIPIEKENNE